MGAKVVQAEGNAVAERGEPTYPVKELVRRLIAEAQQASGAESENGGGEVLIDIEVDGIRCVLSRPAKPQPGANAVLSPRELEIARMIARGYPNKTIAAALDISSWTVCTHLRRSFSKLGVTSRAAMIARMAESGLLDERHPMAV